jgi:uncharacterized membrane protein YccC
MSEIEFLRRAAHCKEALETAADDASRAEWAAMADHWSRLADEAAKAERQRAKREAVRSETTAPPMPPEMFANRG